MFWTWPRRVCCASGYVVGVGLVVDAVLWLKGLSCFESFCDDACGEEVTYRVAR